MIRNAVLILICLLSAALFVSAQDDLQMDFSCQVHTVIPPLSIERATVQQAKTIKDIHRQYKPSWISEFINIEIQTIQNGKTKIAQSKDDALTQEQLDNLLGSDRNTDIYLKIKYIPDNNLKHNEPKIYDATFRINPDRDAQYAAGDEAMSKYLLEQVISKVSDHDFKQYALAAIQFTIDASGRVENVAVKESSKDEAIDQVMVDAICNMPDWKAAEFYEGSKVDQDFVLTIGDMQSCIVPTLGIKRY